MIYPKPYPIYLRGTIALNPVLYLEVHCTYNLLSNCSYNLNISSITIVTLNIIGL